MHAIKVFVLIIKLTDLMEVVSLSMFANLMCFDFIGERNQMMEVQAGLGGVDLFGSDILRKTYWLVHQR